MKLFYRFYLWLLLVIFGIASIVYGISQILKHEIIINWSTATEFQTAGFNLYRAESEQGPYQKVNAKIIPASPDPLVGGDYAYRDNQVKPGHVYFYQLEEIEIDGKVNRQETIMVTSPYGSVFAWLLLFLGSVLVVVGGLGLTGWRRSKQTNKLP